MLLYPYFLILGVSLASTAYGIGRAVYRRPLRFSLLLGDCGAASCRRRTIAREPVCAARSGAARASNCEHHLLSRVPESERSSTGGGGNSPVVDCFLWEPPTLLRNICAAGVITN